MSKDFSGYILPPEAFLVGPNVFLRKMEEKDILFAVRLMNDPDIRRYVNLRGQPLTVEDYRQRILKGDVPELRFMICRRDIGVPVGKINIGHINRIHGWAETGMKLEKEFRGQGIGHEAKELIMHHAFQTMNLHRLEAGVLEDNAASIACLKKSGYVEEGRRKGAFRIDGRRYDDILFAITEERWRELHPDGKPNFNTAK